MRQWITMLITLAGFLCAFEAHSQSTFYVKPGASGTGASWSNASGNIQAMIDGAAAGDQVWVAAGTYKPTGMTGATGTLTARDVSYVLKSGVKVYGGFAGTETSLSQRNVTNNATILSGDIGVAGNNADNAIHVVVSVKNTGETLLDGFTIIHGNANQAGTVALDGINIARYVGGGIYTYLSTATFRNVTVQNNRCEGGDDFFGNGGAIYSGLSQLTIEDAVISENNAARAPTKAGGTSGAIYFFGSATVQAKLVLTRVKLEKNVSMNTVGAVTVSSYSDAEFTDVDFIENTTTGTTGALRIAGADADHFTNFKMKGGSFVKNYATGTAGAIYAFSFSNYHFNDVLFSENESESAGGALFLFSGDAVAVNKDVLFSNCVFYKNKSKITSSLGGGAIFVSNNTQAAVAGCTFYENDARFNGGAIGVFSAATVKLDVSNSIFYRNTTAGTDADFYVGALSTLELANTITQGQGIEGVNGVKVNVDPQFSSTDLANSHFMRLLAASPAVDAGNNDKIPAGVTTDMAGNDRIVNDIVDMGAYEFKNDAGPTLSQTITFASDITKKYGDAKFSPGATAGSGLPISYSSSDPNVAVVEDGELVIKGLGTAQITAGQPGNFEYLPAEDVTRTLTVTKGTLTIQAADTSMIQGDPLPEYRIIYTGFGYDETNDVLTSQPVVSTPATSASPAGEYTLTVSGAGAVNYNVEYETGKLTIVTEYEEGKIRYVKPVVSGTGSGLNWENASADLQAMIDAASAGGEVWVAKGTYKPNTLSGSSDASGSRDVAFVLKSGVGVYGGFTGNEVRRSARNVADNETILSGDVGVSGTNTDNAYHVVVSAGNTAGTILDGFTITDGLSGGTDSYSIGGVAIAKSSGAGVYVIQSQDVLFENLKITRNNTISAGKGGGIYVTGSKVTFRNSVISENVTAGGSAGQGAGIYLIGESGAINETRFINVAIRNNTSVGTGGAGYIGNYTITEFEDSDIEDNTGTEGSGFHVGTGVAGFKTQIKATRTNFRRNIGPATGNGGALLVASYNELELYDCEFTGNAAGYQGGAIYINGNQTSFTKFIVDGCRFSENKLLQASGNGGALRINFFVDAWIKNSVFHDNESGGGAGISFVGSSLAPSENLYVINSVFYNNKSTSGSTGGGAISTSNYMTGNIINSTFYNNEAANEGGGVRILRSRTLTMNVYNSVFNKNKALTGSDVTYPEDWTTLAFKNNYTQVAGTNGVDGVIVGTNPEFESTDPTNEKFLRLSILSEAFNKGDNAYLPLDITTDKDGKDRIIYGVVDMGAYEYDGPPLNPTTAQTITFSGDVAKTYGDANFDPGATTSSGLAVRYTSSNTAVAVVTGDNKIQVVGGGTAQITANQTGNAVYFPADPVSITLTVAKAPLIVKPTDTDVQQGAEFPQFTATYTGLVNGDTESSISTPLITTTATETSPLGTYPLTASGAQSNKYDFTYEPGTLTIVPRVWEPAEKIKVEAWFSSSTQMQVEIDMVTEQNASLVLYTNGGIPVYRMNVALHLGTNKFVIPADRLVSGVYIINVKGPGLKFEKKIIKR